MPTYDYQCEACNHQFDMFESIGTRDAPCDQPCPECNETKVRRGWFNAPVGGVDATLTPDKATGGQWSQLMDKLKKSKVVDRASQKSLEQASNRSGAKYGYQ